MGNEPIRHFLLYILLQSLLDTVDTSSLVVVVEGDSVEIQCSTNSSLGVDWIFNNVTSNYGLFIDGVVTDKFKEDYEVSSVRNITPEIFYLLLKRARIWHAGTYICKRGDDPNKIQTSVQLALLTIPKCELDTDSNATMRSYFCNFTSVGNISSRSEWIRDFCTKSTLTTCSNKSEETVFCEFPINGRNRSFLPFTPNLTSHSTDVCEISCINFEDTPHDGFLNTSIIESMRISVLLQCSVIAFSTTITSIISHDETRRTLLVYGSVAASITGVLLILLTIIIILIFRNTAFKRSAANRTPNEAEPIYYELESPVSVANVPVENNLVYTLNPTDDACGNGSAYCSIPRSSSAAESSLHIERFKSFAKETYSDNPRVVENSAYAVPYNTDSALLYAEVYHDKSNEILPENLSSTFTNISQSSTRML